MVIIYENKLRRKWKGGRIIGEIPRHLALMEGRALIRLGVRLENDGSCKRGYTPPPIRPFSDQARVGRKNGESVEVSIGY
jgi:hypothetical protein